MQELKLPLSASTFADSPPAVTINDHLTLKPWKTLARKLGMVPAKMRGPAQCYRLAARRTQRAGKRKIIRIQTSNQ